MVESHKKLQLVVLIIGAIGAISFAALYPFQHGPDANHYYGVALRLSRGDFIDSVNGMVSPLLSWLMAPLIYFGITAPTAFRAVNVFAFTVILVNSYLFTEVIRMNPLTRLIYLLLVATQLIYFVAGQPTSDLLTAACFTSLLVMMLGGRDDLRLRQRVLIGALAALCYLAKAIELPIILMGMALCLVSERLIPVRSPHSCRHWLGVLVWLLIFSMPWIGVISSHYQRPVISGQQLLRHCRNQSDVPVLPREVGFQIERCLIGEVDEYTTDPAVSVFNKEWSRARDNLGSLVTAIRVNFVGDLALLVCLIGLIWTLPFFQPSIDRKSFVYIWSLLIAHVAGYLATWGPHYRYYLPVVPLFYLLSLKGIERLMVYAISWSSRFSGVVRMAFCCILSALIAFIAAECFVRTFKSIQLSAGDTSDEIANYFLQQPVLRSGAGIVTGRMYDPYAGYLAYRLNREYWGSIDPGREMNSELLEHDLTLGNVEEIWWSGDDTEIPPLPPGTFRKSKLCQKGVCLSIFKLS